MKEQHHPFPEALVPHAVDDHVAAAVPRQDPESKEGEIAPGVAHHVAEHKDSDGRKGGGEGEGEDSNGLGRLDVREGGPVGASATAPNLQAQTALWEQLPLARIAADAGKRHDVDSECATQQGEVEGWEQQHDVGVSRQLEADQQRDVIAHAAALIVLQSEALAQNKRGHGQQEAARPGDKD